MKTGLTKYFRALFTWLNLLRFALYRRLLGFEYANVVLSRMDKHSTKRILRKYGARIGEQSDIESGLIFHNCQDYSRLKIGKNCHIGKNCFFDLRGPVSIQDNTVVSMRCNFITHTDLSKSSLSQLYPSKTAGIHVQSNCYLGVNATLLKGVTIGERSIVGANALVINNLPADSVAGGVPARIIKDLKGASKKAVKAQASAHPPENN